MLVDALAETVRRHAAGPRPSFSAAQLLVLVDGLPVAEVVVGVEAAYDDAEGSPARGPAVAVTRDTRFDLASVTKLFTAAVVLEVLADHGLDLDTPVAEVLAGYRDAPRRQVRFRHLLTHTAGLPPVWSGWRDGPDPRRARRQVLALAPVAPAGERHVYSCIGYVHAGFAVEELAGAPLDVEVARRITGPLGLASTGYRPDPDVPVAATEWQDHPAPGITRGAVHDETARALGGVSGNAGLFGTAADLARFGEALRLGGAGVLRESTVDLMTRPLVAAGLTPGYRQAAGPRLADEANFGRLAVGSLGHTGFTGTMLLVAPRRQLTVAVLTNRVHPSRSWSDPSVLRRDVAAVLAEDGGAA